jgi:hypothetical protein
MKIPTHINVLQMHNEDKNDRQNFNIENVYSEKAQDIRNTFAYMHQFSRIIDVIWHTTANLLYPPTIFLPLFSLQLHPEFLSSV